jgi:hypothetical protein
MNNYIGLAKEAKREVLASHPRSNFTQLISKTPVEKLMKQALR